MEKITKDIPDQVKEAVHQMDEEAEIILFGSRARGDCGPDSDWDFLILLKDKLTSEKEELIRNRIYDIELESEEVITSIIEGRGSNWELSLLEALIVSSPQRANSLSTPPPN